MVTHFVFHGYEIAAAIVGRRRRAQVPADLERGRPGARAAVARGRRTAATMIGYWLHVLIVLTFLNYLPYSKHIHLLGALPNIFTRNRSERRMDLPKLDLEDENQWGVGRFEQLSWKSLLDTYACTECARCTELLPGLQHRQEPVADAARSTTSATRCSTGSRLRDRIAELEGEVAGLARVLAASHGFDERAPPPRPGVRARAARGGPGRAGRDAEADRRPGRRGHAVGVHHLRRLPGGLPGVHRAPGEDHPDAPEPGARAGEDARRAAAHVPQHRAQTQPLGHRQRPADGLGQRASTSRRSRTTPIPSTSCGSAAPARSTTGSSSRPARW